MRRVAAVLSACVCECARSVALRCRDAKYASHLLPSLRASTSPSADDNRIVPDCRPARADALAMHPGDRDDVRCGELRSTGISPAACRWLSSWVCCAHSASVSPARSARDSSTRSSASETLVPTDFVRSSRCFIARRHSHTHQGRTTSVGPVLRSTSGC
jgi:hypothetical protein